MTKKVSRIQKYLKKNNLDAFLVPRTDEYLSEYVASYAERLKWISSFSGSAGMVVILRNKAAIFVDGRYTLQVAKQVNKKIFSIHNIKNFYEWLKNQLPNNSTIAIDSWLFSKKTIDTMKKQFTGKKINLHFVKKNPIDLLWSNQPKKVTSKAFLHNIKFTGQTMEKKIQKIKKELIKKKCDYYIVSSLDSIAWILNLRGSDIKYTPLNFAYLILSCRKKSILYIDLKKINKSVKKKLSKQVNISNNNKILKDIQNIDSNKIVGFDENKTPYWFINQLKIRNIKYKIIEDPCYLSKAIKNKTEINGAKKANIRDGVSITKFLYWLKNQITFKKINEISAAKKLLNIRKKNELFFSPSFETISAFGAHAALPHYMVSKKSNVSLSKNNIYLVDSGGQYFDGTTDITRTVILGKANNKQKELFTRVLKGHIALATVTFNSKTRGSKIDYIARKSLKEINCDYDHGTGHGIGSFLGVHEGPQRIFKSKNANDVYLQPGMILSNEPGYYKINEFGIRIENLILVKKQNNNICFETISWAPIDKDLILGKLLNDFEKNWLNNYHQTVYKKISNYLTYKEKKWLKTITQQI